MVGNGGGRTHKASEAGSLNASVIVRVKKIPGILCSIGNVVSGVVSFNRRNDSIVYPYATVDAHSVLDLGCGDWQFSKLIPWDYYNISYLGLDVFPFIIEKKTATFGTERCQFKVIRKPSEIFDLGNFDLVICKDVLQHLPNSVANEYFEAFVAVGRHALIINDAFTSRWRIHSPR